MFHVSQTWSDRRLASRREGKRPISKIIVLTQILEHMQAKAKKILITTESHEVLVIRRGFEGVQKYCEGCGFEVEWLSFDAAISDSGFGWRRLMIQVETGKVHTHQAATGHLLVCGSSLSGLAPDGAEDKRKRVTKILFEEN